MVVVPVIDAGHRTSSLRRAVALLATAMLVASCGGSDAALESDSSATSTSDIASTEPSTTVATTSSTTTTVPPTATSTTSVQTTTTTTTAAPATTATSMTTNPPATTTAPAPATAAPAVPEYCGTAGPLPAGAVLDSSLTLDLVGDGSVDDVIEAWDVDGWSRLRLTTGGSVVSEIINPAVDGRYRPLGIAPVLPGGSPELFSVVGEGTAATEIGVFGVDTAECLYSYTYDITGDEFTMLIRPASPFRSGAFCFDGGIDLFNAQQRSDGKWDAASAAYEIAGTSTLQYIGGTDGYAEGLEESELGSFEFDCFGLSL